MDAERWTHVERLFQTALDLPPDEHEAFLERSCAGDETLERDVRALLRSAGEAGAFLSGPAIEVAAREIARHANEPVPDSDDQPIGQTIRTITSSRGLAAAAWASSTKRKTRGCIASSLSSS